MSGIDLQGIASSISTTLTQYLENFIAILTNPRTTIRRLLIPGQNGELRIIEPNRERKVIQDALFYTAISIVIGLSFAKFMKLPGDPPAVEMQTVIAVIFVWIFTALLLHPFLKLFKGQGKIAETMVVFLYVISTTHLVFIPITAFLGHLSTETEVTLTYDYVIYYGRSEGAWFDKRIPEYVETYIKEKEPAKEGTVLLPSDSSTLGQRVPIAQSTLPPPKREEVRQVKWPLDWVFMLSIGYYLTNVGYLAQGLSVVHRLSRVKLITLAIVGPLSVFGLFLALLFLITLLT